MCVFLATFFLVSLYSFSIFLILKRKADMTCICSLEKFHRRDLCMCTSHCVNQFYFHFFHPKSCMPLKTGVWKHLCCVSCREHHCWGTPYCCIVNMSQIAWCGLQNTQLGIAAWFGGAFPLWRLIPSSWSTAVMFITYPKIFKIFRYNIIRGTFQFVLPNHAVIFSWSCFIFTSLQTTLSTSSQSSMHENCSAYFIQR